MTWLTLTNVFSMIWFVQVKGEGDGGTDQRGFFYLRSFLLYRTTKENKVGVG